MSNDTDPPNPVEILRDLGLKEYEARCFVALTRMPHGTAKAVSDTADVPRTRVYDAVDQLQAYGLVDVQHSNPQQFRAIPVDKAVTLLRRDFDQQFDDLQHALSALDPIGGDALQDQGNVWTTVGDPSVTNRAIGFIDDADEEIVMVLDGIGADSVSDRLAERLRAAANRGVTIYIGALTESTYEQVTAAVPEARTFESGLEWLQPQTEGENERIGRLLLVDRAALLLSSIGSNGPEEETAIWIDNVSSGLLVIARRLLAAGLDREEESLDETAEEGSGSE
ncbi:transcriptional regulator [Halobacteriales archaeon QH_6_64_20]|jgi:sugar-specific transcriptional regulator TrmB|nr:MAG: transcriptional regulator [Halobacteriales archaeon QH_6_64_20]